MIAPNTLDFEVKFPARSKASPAFASIRSAFTIDPPPSITRVNNVTAAAASAGSRVAAKTAHLVIVEDPR